MGETERPQTQVGSGVRDAAKAVFNRVNRLVNQRLRKVELHTDTHTFHFHTIHP